MGVPRPPLLQVPPGSLVLHMEEAPPVGGLRGEIQGPGEEQAGVKWIFFLLRIVGCKEEEGGVGVGAEGRGVSSSPPRGGDALGAVGVKGD